MRLPFTVDQFLDLFRQYNEAIGITPPVLVCLAALAAGIAFNKYSWRHRAIGALLAALFLWTGVVYHWMFFARINAAAWVFGAIFVAQAAAIVYYTARGRLQFAPRRSISTVLGLVTIAYALIGYPLLGTALGHAYPQGPSFGAPCPATIYFFGMLLLAIDTVPIGVLVLPVIWAAIGTSAALQLGMREDFGLGVSALLVVFAMVQRRAAMSNRARSIVHEARGNRREGQVRL